MREEKREEYIEIEILEYLNSEGILAYHNDIKGFFNQNRGFYQKNKNRYIREGIADVTGILPEGRYLAIEVKTPSELKFFDRSLTELSQAYAEAYARGRSAPTLKRYMHAVSQRTFLDDVIWSGGVAFFADSIDRVKEELEKAGYFFTSKIKQK